MWRLIYIAFAALWLTACASSSKVPLKVHHINSLASEDGNDGGFKGLEFLADPIPGKLKNRVNIIYLHGIGWTEDRTKNQFTLRLTREQSLIPQFLAQSLLWMS